MPAWTDMLWNFKVMYQSLLGRDTIKNGNLAAFTQPDTHTVPIICYIIVCE